MKLRVEDLLASNLSLKNENQLLRNQLDNLRQNHRLEMREKELEMRKMEDDFIWRRSNEAKNSESLLQGVDLLQAENLDLKRDVDGLRSLVEEKEDRIRDLHLERRKQQRVMEDFTEGRMTRTRIEERAQQERKNWGSVQGGFRKKSGRLVQEED